MVCAHPCKVSLNSLVTNRTKLRDQRFGFSLYGNLGAIHKLRRGDLRKEGPLCNNGNIKGRSSQVSKRQMYKYKLLRLGELFLKHFLRISKLRDVILGEIIINIV